MTYHTFQRILRIAVVIAALILSVVAGLMIGFGKSELLLTIVRYTVVGFVSVFLVLVIKRITQT